MAIREKMKKAFGVNKKNSSSADSSPNGAGTPNKHPDVEYYKPGEIPRSKYRGPWNQKHQDALHSFSFSDAFGRSSSIPSVRSPLAQSRRSSWISRHTLSRLNSSAGKSDADAAEKKLRRQKSVPKDQVVENADDEADVANVGLSKQNTALPPKPSATRQTNADADRKDEEVNDLTAQRTVTQHNSNEAQNDSPFTAEELVRAMTAVTVKSGP